MFAVAETKSMDRRALITDLVRSSARPRRNASSARSWVGDDERSAAGVDLHVDLRQARCLGIGGMGTRPGHVSRTRVIGAVELFCHEKEPANGVAVKCAVEKRKRVKPGNQGMSAWLTANSGPPGTSSSAAARLLQTGRSLHRKASAALKIAICRQTALWEIAQRFRSGLQGNTIHVPTPVRDMDLSHLKVLRPRGEPAPRTAPPGAAARSDGISAGTAPR